MAPDRDQYVQFTIKLLKGSFALSALWQDAVNYHMIDQPDKLIALRLTEYYELVARGVSRSGLVMQSGITPGASPALTNTSTLPPSQLPAVESNGSTPVAQPAESHSVQQTDDIVTSSPSTIVEQNADEAADYWAAL